MANRNVARAVRLALVTAGALGAGVYGTTAAAQTELATIVVTGTRITAPGVTSSSPIVSVGADELSIQQQPEIERVLRLMPMTAAADGQNRNNGSAGASTVSLRGLGAQRNLVMIDGHRLTPYDENGIVDLAQIPQALVERMDVITGGASAVYGSDAISGAVNFVLKRDFEGVEITSNYTQSEENDGEVLFVSALMGGNFADGRGNAALNVHYTDRTGILLGQRFLGTLGIDSASGANYSNFLANQGPTLPPADCQAPNAAVAGGSTTTMPTRVAIAGGPGLGQFRNDGSLGANCSVFNFNPYNWYQTPQEKYGITSIARYSVTDNAEVYGRISYVSTVVTQQVAPSGVFGTPFWTPLANPFISAPALNTILTTANSGRVAGTVNTGGAFPNWRDINNNGVVDAADELYISYRRRTLELGPRSTAYDGNYYQFVLGLRGDLMDWEYDVSFQRGQSNRTNISAGYTNVTNIANALDAVSTTTCRGGDSSCVPINLFGGFGTITPAMAAYAGASAFTKDVSTQTVATATATRVLDQMKTPWADHAMGVSFGTEWRAETASSTPDECWKLAPASCLGGAGGNLLPISGKYDVFELFGEAILPIASGKPGIESLDLELGYRWSDYNLTGASETWKAGISWRPVDQLLLRVMKQKALRGANVGELFSPITTGLADANLDPCSIANAANITPALQALCISTGMTAAQVGTVENVVSGQINFFDGSDPLNPPKPESADTLTVGLVWTPEFFGERITNPTFGIDYYDVDITDVIGTFGSEEILSGCYTAGFASECAKVVRVGGTLTLPGSGLRGLITNLDYLRAEGIEFNVAFGVDLGEWGTMNISANVNKYLTQESQSASYLDVIDCKGYYGTQCGNPLPDIRWIQRTVWNHKDYMLGYLWRHIGATKIEPAIASGYFPKFRSIDSHDYIDLYAGWQATDGIRVNLTVANVLAKDPPVVGNEVGTTATNFGNTFPAVYDTLGRFYTLGVNFKF